MNYNNNSTLFMHVKGMLQIVDGHIFKQGEGYLARCTDDKEARKVLRDAGFKNLFLNTWEKYPIKY